MKNMGDMKGMDMSKTDNMADMPGMDHEKMDPAAQKTTN